MEMHLHTRNISAAAMYMKEQRSTQLKILVVGIAGIKLQKVRLSVIYDRVRNRKNNFEIPDFLNFWMENLKSGKFKWKQNTNKHISVAGKTGSAKYTLNFPAHDFPHSIGRKAGISK